MSFENNYNVIKKFAAFPCAQPSPLVIALTALPAIAPAIVEYASFGCRDILKARLGKQAPCGRALKAQVSKALPPKWTGLAGKLLAFEADFSRAGDKFMIMDLTADFAARWTSLAYELSGCPDANTGSNWTIEYSAPEILLPGVPTLLGGVVTNVTGDGTGVSPIGVNCPAGYFAQINFKVQAREIFGTQNVPLSTWVRRVGGGNYDYAATKRRPGYPWQLFENRYTFTQENDGTGFPVQYEMYAMSEGEALTSELHADCSCTPSDPSLLYMSPLGCLRDMLSQRIEDPAGRNPKPGNRLVPGFSWGRLNPKPVRGPPGGKPRAKR